MSEKLIYKIRAYTGYEAYACTYICDDGTILVKEELPDGKVLGHYVRDLTLQSALLKAEAKAVKLKKLIDDTADSETCSCDSRGKDRDNYFCDVCEAKFQADDIINQLDAEVEKVK